MLQFLYVEKGVELNRLSDHVHRDTGECLDLATFFIVARFLLVVRARGGGGSGNR